jgi:hypothetical protein
MRNVVLAATGIAALPVAPAAAQPCRAATKDSDAKYCEIDFVQSRPWGLCKIDTWSENYILKVRPGFRIDRVVCRAAA